MTDRDRLIELMLEAPQIPCIKGGQATGKRYQTFQNIADHLLANGIILPPCKVGDSIYYVGVFTGKIVKSCVTGVNYIDDDIILFCKNGSWVSVKQQLGDIVFLTKEQAEAKLREKQNEK